MIWIWAQDKNLYECSAFEIEKITPSQIQIINQNKKILGEYTSIDKAEKVIGRIRDYIVSHRNTIFEMPPRFEDNTN